jgi:hypothetical protein
MAPCPTPPGPPWTSTFWPACTLARSMMSCQAAIAISGRAAASRIESDFGFWASKSALATTISASVPCRPRERRLHPVRSLPQRLPYEDPALRAAAVRHERPSRHGSSCPADSRHLRVREPAPDLLREQGVEGRPAQRLLEDAQRQTHAWRSPLKFRRTLVSGVAGIIWLASSHVCAACLNESATAVSHDNRTCRV